MIMWQLVVEPESRRLAQDQDDFIECLNCLRTFDWSSTDPQTGRIQVSPVLTINGDTATPQDSPIRVVACEITNGSPQILKPPRWEVHVLVTKDHQVV